MIFQKMDIDDHFTILYFAAVSSYTNKQSERFKAPLGLQGQQGLTGLLENKYPGIQDKLLESCALTINLEYIDMDDLDVVIKAGDEVAIIPPVSSG